MATDWGFEENATDALTRLANIVDEAAESTADDENLRIVSVSDDGTIVNPDEAPNYPNRQEVAHDLDPNVDGDLVIEAGVEKSQAVLVSANSMDGVNWSASAEWIDDSDNVYQTESATDIAMSSVVDEHSRLYRKGPRVRITFTSDSSAGTTNRVNAFLDTHR